MNPDTNHNMNASAIQLVGNLDFLLAYVTFMVYHHHHHYIFLHLCIRDNTINPREAQRDR